MVRFFVVLLLPSVGMAKPGIYVTLVPTVSPTISLKPSIAPTIIYDPIVGPIFDPSMGPSLHPIYTATPSIATASSSSAGSSATAMAAALGVVFGVLICVAMFFFLRQHKKGKAAKQSRKLIPGVTTLRTTPTVRTESDEISSDNWKREGSIQSPTIPLFEPYQHGYDKTGVVDEFTMPHFWGFSYTWEDA